MMDSVSTLFIFFFYLALSIKERKTIFCVHSLFPNF